MTSLSNKKPIVWVDMDGVLVDLEQAIVDVQHKLCIHPTSASPADQLPLIFRYALPMEGAIEAITTLSEHFDLHVATACPSQNTAAATDKLCWLQQYFGTTFYKKVTITHSKHLLKGDYLIDDRLTNGASSFEGRHIHFGTPEFATWKQVVSFLLTMK